MPFYSRIPVDSKNVQNSIAYAIRLSKVYVVYSNRIESNDSSLNLIQVRLTKVLFAMSQREMRDKCDKRHIAKACILCMRVSKIE